MTTGAEPRRVRLAETGETDNLCGVGVSDLCRAGFLSDMFGDEALKRNSLAEFGDKVRSAGDAADGSECRVRTPGERTTLGMEIGERTESLFDSMP